MHKRKVKKQVLLRIKLRIRYETFVISISFDKVKRISKTVSEFENENYISFLILNVIFSTY